MKKMMILLGCFVMLTAMGARAALINGGFEDPALADGTQVNYSPGQSFTGWTVGGGVSAAVFDPTSSYATQSHSGENYLYLYQQNTVVIQDVGSLVVGQKYRVTGYVAKVGASTYGGYVLGLVSTDWVTAVGDLFYGGGITQGPSGNSNDWIYVETPWYTAVSGDESKAFEVHAYCYGGGSSGSIYTGYDDLNLEVIPEPATVGLLCLGGLLIRRRR